MTKRVARPKSRKEVYRSKAYWAYLESRSILISFALANVYSLDTFLTRCMVSTAYWSGHKAKRDLMGSKDRDPCAKSTYDDLDIPPVRPYDHRLRVYALDPHERRLVTIANRLMRPVALRLRDPFDLTSDVCDEVIDLSNEPDPA